MPIYLKNKGFTLVELLVVISIIAILASVGVSVFGNISKNARDARRKSDIEAIVAAYEINKNGNGAYITLTNSHFASGNIPSDPKSGQMYVHVLGCGDSTINDGWTNSCWYCFKADPTTNGYCVGSDHWLTRDLTAYPAASIRVCANLETGSPAYFCRGTSY